MLKNYDLPLPPMPAAGISAFNFARYLRRLLPQWIARTRTNRIQFLVPPLAKSTIGEAPSLKHQHPMPEVVLQISGGARYMFPGGELLTQPGTVCLIPGGTPHRESGTCRRAAFPSYNVIFSHYLSDLIEIHLGRCDARLTPRVLASCHVLARDNERHVKNLNALVDVIQRRPPAWRDHAAGLMLGYLGAMLDLLQEPIAQVQYANEKTGICMHLISTYLEDSALSVKRLADWIHCSPNYLSSLFRRSTGRRIREVLVEKRLAKARELLRDPRLTIKEVAFAVGFRHPGHFIHTFRQKTQCTPRQWRQIQPKDVAIHRTP